MRSRTLTRSREITSGSFLQSRKPQIFFLHITAIQLFSLEKMN